jgi:hypothetical protein
LEQTESYTVRIEELKQRHQFLIKEIVILTKSNYHRTKKLVKEDQRVLVERFQLGDPEIPELTTIGSIISKDLQQEGLSRNAADVAVSRYVDPEYKRPYEKSGSRISEPEFEEMEESVFDHTEEMAERVLSDKQLDKLSEAERREVLEQEINTRKSRKTIDNDRIKHLQEYADKKE